MTAWTKLLRLKPFEPGAALIDALRGRSTTRCAEDVEGAIGPRSGFIPLFTAALAPWPAPAPHLLAHEDKNEHDSNRQENQWPHRGADAARAMSQR